MLVLKPLSQSELLYVSFQPSKAQNTFNKITFTQKERRVLPLNYHEKYTKQNTFQKLKALILTLNIPTLNRTYLFEVPVHVQFA